MSSWRYTPPFLYLNEEQLEEYYRMVSPGSPRGQCINCGEYFNSDAAFDKHQRMAPETEAGVICLNPASLGMEKLASGHWVTARLEESPWEVKDTPNPWLNS